MGAILLIFGLALFFVIRSSLLYEVRQDVRGHAEEVASGVRSGEGLSRAETRSSTLDGVFVIVRDEEGEVIYQNIDLKNDVYGGESGKLWREALTKDRPVGGVVEAPGEDPDYLYAVPVAPQESGARVVEAGKPYDNVHETIELIGALLAAGFAVALLVSVAGSYFLARVALSPVEAIAGAARKITESDLSTRLPVSNPDDEIGRLTSTVNGLLSRLEAAFARREEALQRQSEALARQRSFAADASHELRTPLSTIGGYARMLKEWGHKDPKATRKGVEAIENESERMHHMVEELLELTRGDEGVSLTLERKDLAAIAKEATEAVRDTSGRKVSVEYGTEAPVQGVFDADRIRQLATILLENAVKYTPEGGAVRVRVREEEGWAELEVSDTGVGIAEDQLPLIFERFHRADPARSPGGAGGTGLGLAIARQIAEAHGGVIEVHSSPGKGSTFTLRIPEDGPPGQ
jgi:two-component system OmpR family sensor kinase